MQSLVKTLILSLTLLFSSCSTKREFTSSMRYNYGLSEPQLKQLQFYTSEEITLYRSQENVRTRIKSGKLIISNTQDDQTIIIPKDTPCILVKDQGETFVLSFESSPGKTLVFGILNDYYTLFAQNWVNDVGNLQYDGMMYYTSNGDVYLKVKMRQLNHLKKHERTVYGRKL